MSEGVLAGHRSRCNRDTLGKGPEPKIAFNVAFFVRHMNFLHPGFGNLQEVSRESVHISMDTFSTNACHCCNQLPKYLRGIAPLIHWRTNLVARALYAIDSEALTVLYSTAQSVGDTVINNSDSPNGTQYTFGAGYSTLQVIVEDTGGSADILEDDNHTSHIVTDGAGLVANGTGIEAESVIQLQEMSASGIPIGPIINIYVLSQNGVTADVWGFVSDTMLAPGTNYQKVGGGNIGSTDYANFQTPWLVTVDGTVGNDVMGVGYTDVDGDQIDGSDGNNDAIYGYGGNDSITAGAGNDTLVGGTGADSLDGGTRRRLQHF